MIAPAAQTGDICSPRTQYVDEAAHLRELALMPPENIVAIDGEKSSYRV